MSSIPKTMCVWWILLGMLLTACSARDADEPEFRVVGSSPPNSPWSMQWQRFSEHLAEAQDVSLEPSLYVHGQLGDPERSIQSLQRGRVQLGGFPLSAAAALVPEVALLHAPFVFTSEAEIDHVIDHYLEPAFNELFEARGVTVLSWTEAGWNHLYASRPVRTPDALVNFPIRTQPTLGSRVLFSALEADVRPIPYSDLLSSLQTRLVHGADGNLVMYFAAGLVDEAPHLTLTGHVFEVGVILANSAWWQSRSQAERTAIRAALGPRTRLRSEVAAQTDELMNAALAEQRVQVHRPDAAEMREWRALGPGVRERLVQEIGGEAVRIDELITAGQRSFATADGVH